MFRDNYDRVKNHAAPEWEDVRKARRVMTVVWVVGLLAFAAAVTCAIMFIPFDVLVPMVIGLAVVALVVYVIVFDGIEHVFDFFEWIGEQRDVLASARRIGVRDE